MLPTSTQSTQYTRLDSCFVRSKKIDELHLPVEQHDASDEGIVTPLTRDMIDAFAELKYYYAGGSARFMFDYPVLEELEKQS